MPASSFEALKNVTAVLGAVSLGIGVIVLAWKGVRWLVEPRVVSVYKDLGAEAFGKPIERLTTVSQEILSEQLRTRHDVEQVQEDVNALASTVEGMDGKLDHVVAGLAAVQGKLGIQPAVAIPLRLHHRATPSHGTGGRQP